MTRAYYDDGGITLYHGDCREIVPALGRVDLLLTDPPYGMNLDTDNSRFSGGRKGHRGPLGGSGTGAGESIRGDDKPFNPSFMLSAATKNIIWGWNHFPEHLPRGTCLVWIKRNDDAFGSFLSDAEVAWYSHGRGVYCMRDLSNNAIANERVHPTQKPLALMLWCIRLAGDSAQTILDPFAGSGTTGVAAKLMGRKAVLVECEERYCEIAARRLSQGVLAFGAPP